MSSTMDFQEPLLGGDDDLGLLGKFQCHIFKLLQSLAFPFLKVVVYFSTNPFHSFLGNRNELFSGRECIYDPSSMRLFVPKVEVN